MCGSAGPELVRNVPLAAIFEIAANDPRLTLTDLGYTAVVPMNRY
jgi:hypothetical protein